MNEIRKARVSPGDSREHAVVRCRAPLRLGLAGGGTDLSPYCDEYGGSVLNITIARYAFTSIEPRSDGKIHFISNDLGQEEMLDAALVLDSREGLRLHRAVYNRIVREHAAGVALSLTLTTSVDCPMGAGLGASSALTVSMVGAYCTWLGLPLGDFEIAHLAYEVERHDLGMTGGRQDQYAATFGGINFLEFAGGGRVIVNPLRLERRVVHELEASLMLCFTGASRLSSEVIDQQVTAMRTQNSTTIEAMHQLKRDALEMKAALLREELNLVPAIINRSWAAKKQTSSAVSTSHIDILYSAALESGALAGKISGAGGGGFMMLLINPVRREAIKARLEQLGATVSPCNFTEEGVFGWRAPNCRVMIN